MEIKKETLVIAVLVGAVIFSVYGLTHDQIISEQIIQPLTGYQALEVASSRVQIQAYLAIAKSDDLTEGIDFGTIEALPISQANATGNYNPSSAGATEYNITVSTDSNTAVDFCIRANSPLATSSGAEIGIGNYTWQNSTLNNINEPAKFGKPISTTFQADTQGVSPGESNHYRFWLNVSAAQEPGFYNNTIFFQAVPTLTPCS